MVHGSWYSVQYEIHLTKPLDVYDDVLPICSSVRQMLTYEENKKDEPVKYRLIVIDNQELNKRFDEKQLARPYAEALSFIQYNRNLPHVNRKTEPTSFEYQDVYTYARLIKHANSVIPLTNTHEQELHHRLSELCELRHSTRNDRTNDNAELSQEIYKLHELLEMQTIISNPEYYAKIRAMEQDLTDIELTKEEMDVINAVKNHPTLSGQITFSGFHLVIGDY